MRHFGGFSNTVETPIEIQWKIIIIVALGRNAIFVVFFLHPFAGGGSAEMICDTDDTTGTKDDRQAFSLSLSPLKCKQNWKMHFNYHLQHVNIPLDF